MQKKSKRAVKTYVSGANQHVAKLVPKVPVLPSILEELDSKERRSLRASPRVPVSLIRVIVYESGITAVLPFLVVFGDFSQITILVDVVRKDKHTSFCCVAKARWRRSWKLAKEHGWIRSHVETLVGENDRDGVDACRLAILIGNNMTDSAVVEPECLSTVGYGDLNGLDGRFEGRDEDRFVISMEGSTKCGHYGKEGNLDSLLVCEGVFGDGRENQVPGCVCFANAWTRKLDQILRSESVVPRFKTEFSNRRHIARRNVCGGRRHKR